MNNLIRKNFTQIPNELINDFNLSRDARFLFIYLASKPDSWEFNVSNIEKAIGCSKDSRIKYMKELSNAGWIDYEQTKKQTGEFGGFDIVLNPFPYWKKTDAVPGANSSDTAKNEIQKKAESEKNGSGENTPHSNNKDLSNTNLFSNTESTIVVSKEILKYLNEVRGSKIPFKMIPSNLKWIEARLKEKFTFEDFKKVIDFKVSQWKNDEKMSKYIRPETLFGNKFNGYLVESNDPKNQSSSSGSNNFEFSRSNKVEFL